MDMLDTVQFPWGKGIALMRKLSLKYVTVTKLNIRRVKKGKSFHYFIGKNKVTAKHTLERIRKMALPPAWTDVHIASSPYAHIQAVGVDAKGRKQYRYHETWTQHRNETKFHRMAAFAKVLPKIRTKIKKHLSQPGLSRERVLAAAVDVLQKTNIRVGNNIYTKTNHSYGLTTLENGHAKIHGAKIHLNFRAKSGKQREVNLTDERLSKILKRCQELPGQKLFEYRDEEGRIRRVTSCEINRFIYELTGQHFTAKDFRTWCGTMRALELIKSSGPCEHANDRDWRKRHLDVIRKTADFLGNTAPICEKYYIHPTIFSADRSRRIFALKPKRRISGLTPLEAAALELLA